MLFSDYPKSIRGASIQLLIKGKKCAFVNHILNNQRKLWPSFVKAKPLGKWMVIGYRLNNKFSVWTHCNRHYTFNFEVVFCDSTISSVKLLTVYLYTFTVARNRCNLFQTIKMLYSRGKTSWIIFLMVPTNKNNLTRIFP